MEKYLPLFPLDAVLLPAMVLPLHIFEDRYKEMIRECLLSKAPFGVLYAHDENIEKIGCLAEITQVVKNYEDGRMDILTTGRDRFEVVYFDSEKSYLRGVVNLYGDPDLDDLPTEQEANHLIEKAQEVRRLLTKGNVDPADFATAVEGLSFKIASALSLNNGIKQQIIAERSERERVQTLLNYLSELISRLHQIEEVARRAARNGDLNRKQAL